jgi:hypothetical protein
MHLNPRLSGRQSQSTNTYEFVSFRSYNATNEAYFSNQLYDVQNCGVDLNLWLQICKSQFPNSTLFKQQATQYNTAHTASLQTFKCHKTHRRKAQ